MSLRFLLLFSLAFLLLSSAFTPALSKSDKDEAEEEEDLSFLEEADHKSDATHHHLRSPDSTIEEEDGELDDDDFGNYGNFDDSDSDPYKEPEVDDKDVVVLKERNFTTVIENNQFVMVEFYAPWCGHCQALAPEHAAPATELKAEGVVLAKMDATEKNELAQECDVQGFPTVHFFVDGKQES